MKLSIVQDTIVSKVRPTLTHSGNDFVWMNNVSFFFVSVYNVLIVSIYNELIVPIFISSDIKMIFRQLFLFGYQSSNILVSRVTNDGLLSSVGLTSC